jgi:hypothetical protein
MTPGMTAVFHSLASQDFFFGQPCRAEADQKKAPLPAAKAGLLSS